MRVLPNISFMNMTSHQGFSFCLLIINQLTIKPTPHNLELYYSSTPILATNFNTSQDRLSWAAITKTKEGKNNSHLTQQKIIFHLFSSCPTEVSPFESLKDPTETPFCVCGGGSRDMDIFLLTFKVLVDLTIKLTWHSLTGENNHIYYLLIYRDS